MKRSKRWADALTSASQIWQAGYSMYNVALDHYERRTRFTVSIDVHDEIYGELQHEVVTRLPSRNQRSLAVVTVREASYKSKPWHDDDGLKDDRALQVYFEGEMKQYINVDGHRIGVSILKPSESTEGPASGKGSLLSPRLQFSASSERGREAVLAMMRRATERYERNRVGNRFWVASKYGDWRREPSIAGRDLRTVILPPGHLSDIVEDIERFMSGEDTYDRLGLPWHRGYIFHGPPGTGKTSVARALATHFGFDLYYLPLSDFDVDGDLMAMVSRVQQRSILLIEDVDVARAAKARNDENDKRVTLSALLNSLDGAATPHGLITIMTTNALDSLDPALLRPGRADQIYHMDYLVDAQFADLMELITGRRYEEVPSVEDMQITPADILEWAKSALDDPETAEKLILEKVWQRDVATVWTR